MNKTIEFTSIIDLSDEYKQKLREWRNQEFVRKNMFTNDIISEQKHNKFLKKLEHDNNKKYFVAFYKNKPFGVLNYYFLCEQNSLEFGYYLIDSNSINSGFGIILEYVLLNYAFDILRANKVFCRTLKVNTKVVNLHTKFGFKKDVYNKNYFISDDINPEDVCYQYININMWNEARPKIEKIINYIINLDCIGQLY